LHKYRFVLSGGQMLHQIWAVNQASHLSLQPVVPLLEFGTTTSTSGRPPCCVEAPHLLLYLILYFHLRMFPFLIGSDGNRQPVGRAVSLIDAPWQSYSRGCSFSNSRASFARNFFGRSWRCAQLVIVRQVPGWRLYTKTFVKQSFRNGPCACGWTPAWSRACYRVPQLARTCGRAADWAVGFSAKLFLSAASAEDRLLLLDLAESACRGHVVDIRGAPAFKARPLRDFNFRVKALPFAARADQHELATAGDELLEINKEHTTHLASGWVAARRAGASAYLWYPLDRCRVVQAGGS